MTEQVLAVGRRLFGTGEFNIGRAGWRTFALLVIALLLVSSPEVRAVTMQAMADAYLQVTVFVAGTLAIVYSLEHVMKADLGRSLSRAGRWQSAISAFLGALPGCGGAIIVVTQYTRGYVSFGSVVSVLVATMGDAAFLLLAREPMTGLLIFAVGLGIGTVSGWVVDAIHGTSFMRPDRADDAAEPPCLDGDVNGADAARARGVFRLSPVWLAWLIPGIALGILVAFQVDTDAFTGSLSAVEPTLWFGFAGALLCFVMWVFAPAQNSHAGRQSYAVLRQSTWARIILDTNFITTWVIFGFLVFEIATYLAGSGIEHFFKVWTPFLPLMGVLVGFLPGCGPQIVVTTLYLSGLVPLSAQLGNAISNDGDALFPAIALAPRAAVLATLYSGVPALIVAYGYFFAFE